MTSSDHSGLGELCYSSASMTESDYREHRELLYFDYILLCLAGIVDIDWQNPYFFFHQ